jgi:hypothetical protein
VCQLQLGPLTTDAERGEQVVDQTSVTISDAPGSRRGMSRRDLIRNAGIAGAAAWTAPVILESMSSKAMAATGSSCTQPLFKTVSALEHGTTSPFTVTLPANVPGNLIVIVASYRSDTATAPTIAGYSTLGTNANTSANPDLRMAVFWKLAGASEPNPSLVYPGGGVAAIVLVYSCVNQTTPIDAGPTNNTSTVSNITAASVTTVTPNALVVNVISGDVSAGATGPGSPWSLRASGATYGPQFLGAADTLKATAGAQAGGQWSKIGSGNPDWASISFAIRTH